MRDILVFRGGRHGTAGKIALLSRPEPPPPPYSVALAWFQNFSQVHCAHRVQSDRLACCNQFLKSVGKCLVCV